MTALSLCPECLCANGAPHYVTCSRFGQLLPKMAEPVEIVDQPELYAAQRRAAGYVFVKGCDSCPLKDSYECCNHPAAPSGANALKLYDVPKDKAHPDCPLRKHSLHIALEPTA